VLARGGRWPWASPMVAWSWLCFCLNQATGDSYPADLKTAQPLAYASCQCANIVWSDLGVMWRKRSQGTWSEKGNRWVERVLSFRHTCRIRGQPTLPLLVEAVTCLFKGQVPDLRWITRQESLPACSTP
jgi:hypothetical protein